MSGKCIFLALLFTAANAVSIKLLECAPPHVPDGGNYSPKQITYQPGDTVLYFCLTDTLIDGNYLRKCQDTGKWTGETPICDEFSAFSSRSQTSTADYLSEAELADDGRRDTCSSTEGAPGDEWYGAFLKPGELKRVMLFLPKGPTSFQVILVNENGEEILCGSQSLDIDRYDWIVQTCPESQKARAKGVKIRSLSEDPIQICEIQPYVLPSPKCKDPHVRIVNGHLILSRTKATLVCDRKYIRSRDRELSCIRDGEWDNKNLECTEPTVIEELDEGIPKRRQPNPDLERDKIRRPGGDP